ncbi:hypothetical protein N7533_010118 [Penicillium manginii]|uniref:uncharacterized protein n=1 Tax=Penicillium manginii TaxID=203109 RepID=UPI00254930C8|nr:uncharacterized protein N7533_010118 [Penicillium manginii]KAJ5743016.1 hypothetical protein N7533_010118 [Penicillium manginii]
MTSPVPFLTNLTIAVSGNLSDGQMHSDIQRLTERYGGRFEALDIAACTHLVASRRAVDVEFKKGLNFTPFKEASVTEGLQVVSQDWFFLSVEKEMLLDTKKFLLVNPFKRKGQAKASDEKPPAKPPVKSPDASHKKPLARSPPKTHAKIDEKKQELNAIIADAYVGPKTDLVVWLDANNLIWDATLIKDNSTKKSNGTVASYVADMDHLQILYNLKTKAFQFWAHEYFEKKTGLLWENRWDDPKEGQYVFVPRIFEDVETEDTFFPGTENTTKPSAAPIFLPRSTKSDEPRARLLLVLGRCYLALMWNNHLDAPPKWDLPAHSKDKSWLKQERAALELLHNLSFSLDLMENSTKVSKNQILNRAYRGLGLASMTPVKAGTAEYKALANFLSSSVSPRHSFSVEPVNIFRIEREGEYERFERYQKAHSTLVGDRRLLFHGSSAVNWIGILSQGLRTNAQTRVTTESPINGIYFADVSSKSASYCRHMPGDPGSCMLLCEVEVGKKPQVCDVAPPGVIKAMHKQGHISYLAAGKTDYNKWCDAEAVHPSLAGVQMPDTPSGRSNSKIDPKSVLTFSSGRWNHNEWVVYDPAQIRQRYFFQFRTTARPI